MTLKIERRIYHDRTEWTYYNRDRQNQPIKLVIDEKTANQEIMENNLKIAGTARCKDFLLLKYQ